jgi:hypothetical protein
MRGREANRRPTSQLNGGQLGTNRYTALLHNERSRGQQEAYQPAQRSSAGDKQVKSSLTQWEVARPTGGLPASSTEVSWGQTGTQLLYTMRGREANRSPTSQLNGGQLGTNRYKAPYLTPQPFFPLQQPLRCIRSPCEIARSKGDFRSAVRRSVGENNVKSVLLKILHSLNCLMSVTKLTLKLSLTFQMCINYYHSTYT